MELLLTIALLVFGCSAVPIHIMECTYKGRPATGKLLSIDIELPADNPCSTGGRVCDLTSNSIYNVTVGFHASERSETANSSLVFHLGSADVNFIVQPPIACGNSLTCPILAGTNVSYKGSLKLPCFNQALRGVAEWTVVGDNDKALFCFVLPFFIHPSAVINCI